MHIIGFALVLIHLFLWIWSAGGFMEMMTTDVPWKPYTNPEFPFWVLILHWGSVFFTSSVFLFGYFSRWNRTPVIMAIGYGLMALVCLIETFGYMSSDYRYIAMVAEYLAYAVILLMIFKSRYFTGHFNRDIQL